MTLRAAEEHYAQQAALAALVARRVGQLWSRVPASDVNVWRSLGPQALSLVSAGQLAAATAAGGYVAAALEEQGADIDAEAQVRPAGFVGMPNPEPPADLIDLPRIQVLQAIGQGATAAAALVTAGRRLQTYATTLVQDASRQADSVATFARPRVGWVRMVNPPCCERCAILAGRWFKGNAGFQRHPRC